MTATKVDKVRRKNREECVANHQVENLQGLYFDGKKSDTKSIVRNPDGTKKHRLLNKEHLVLVQEPGNKYIGHVTPEPGTAENVSDSIIVKLRDMQIDTQNLKVLGGDGCNLNVGWRGGVMRLLEEKLNLSLFKIVCLLHLGEVLFKKVVRFYYGKHKGPKDFPILGPELEICHTLPVIKFKKICSKFFPKMEIEGLSNDQKYLFAMGLAVRSGKVDPRLAYYTPGPLNHARWLTMAARILRLYVSKVNPSKELVALTTYIIKVYISFWQAVKTNSAISMGSRHFLTLVQKTRQVCLSPYC